MARSLFLFFSYFSQLFLGSYKSEACFPCSSTRGVMLAFLYVQSICRDCTQYELSVLTVHCCSCSLSNHLWCLFALKSGFCSVKFRNLRFSCCLYLTLNTELWQGGTGCFHVYFSCWWRSSHLRLCMYYRTVCSLSVKSQLSMSLRYSLLIPTEWVVSITCGRDGMRCPILTSDCARAVLVFSWVMSQL